jgi:hypothetical protein
MISAHEAYIRARFAAAAVTNDPFPHLVIRDVLPPALYAEMESNCPSALECTMSTLRLRLRRTSRLGFTLPLLLRTDEQPMFALRGGDRTTPPLGRYAKLWQQRYAPYIELIDRLTIEAYRDATATFLDRMRATGFVRQIKPLAIGQGLFTHRTETWRIGPHVHSSGQIIQSMIYFPLPGSSPEQGTVFFRLKKPKTVPAIDLMQTFVFADDEIEPAGAMPYHPNTLASFLNTPLAIHASPDVPGPARRYTFTAAVMDGVSAPAGDIDLQRAFQ